MGITIKSKNFSKYVGYVGFEDFKTKVAELTNVEFGEHYKKLDDGILLWDGKMDDYFKEYDKITNELVGKNMVSVEIANFCYQPDCKGSIDQIQARQIYEVIKEYDDNVCYGYSEKINFTMFSDLKNIFRDCAENGDSIDWID